MNFQMFLISQPGIKGLLYVDGLIQVLLGTKLVEHPFPLRKIIPFFK